MGVVLITVVRGNRRRDLAVRSDVPVSALLRPLLDALTADPGDEWGQARGVDGRGPDFHDGHGGDPGSTQPDPDLTPNLDLAPVCGPALPRDRSLEACGVGHGSVLVLLDQPAADRPQVR